MFFSDYPVIVQSQGSWSGEVKGEKNLIPNHALAMSPFVFCPYGGFWPSEAIGFTSKPSPIYGKEAITLPATAPRGYVAAYFSGKFLWVFVKEESGKSLPIFLYPQEWRIRCGIFAR